MCKDKDNGAQDGAQKPKKVIGIPFTPMNAKQAQEASIRARNLRKQMRAQLLDAAIKEGIDKLFIKAMKSGDSDMRRPSRLSACHTTSRKTPCRSSISRRTTRLNCPDLSSSCYPRNNSAEAL